MVLTGGYHVYKQGAGYDQNHHKPRTGVKNCANNAEIMEMV